MNRALSKLTAYLLCAALTASMALPAMASFAMGEDLTARDTLLHEQTQLSTNVFWSTSSSDLRTEQLVTYSPNEHVTPVVTFGQTLTERSTVSAMAKRLEEQGLRVVAGINGDFYNVGTGLPVGIVITEGQLRSTDGGYNAIGFRRDGTAIIGKPQVKVTADLGYEKTDSYGVPTELLRPLAGVNKARVSTGGIYLYTYEFNAKHTTGTTEPGVDVVCDILEGDLRIGGSVTLQARQVIEATAATPIGPEQMVLSVNAQSNSYYVDALRDLPVGSVLTVTAQTADPAWSEVDYAVGALYALVENGAVASGLEAGASPRTAIGQREDGTLVFYTMDGRRAGYSIGATMSQVAQRLIELGCVQGVCLDGGGSTALSITQPDAWNAALISRPSDGKERAVSNQLFLVADNTPSGRLDHFYVHADHAYVLAGSQVHIAASAVDTNYLPMDSRYTLSASDGTMDGDILTTPLHGGDITVTASMDGRQGQTTVHAIAQPTAVAIRGADNAILSSLTVAPGTSMTLIGSASYNHIPLKADPEAFVWTLSGDVGTLDPTGRFTATAPGSGTITVSAGAQSATIPVTVTNMALQTVEDFESGTGTLYRLTPTNALSFAHNTNMEYVARGKGSLALSYNGAYKMAYIPMAYTVPAVYTSLNFWVYGDGSGNELYINDLYACTLDFTGWKLCSIRLPEGATELNTITLQGPEAELENEETGDTNWDRLPLGSGTIYLDQLTASYNGIVDANPPHITLHLDSESRLLTAAVKDAEDGVLPAAAVTVTLNGKKTAASYDAATGDLSLTLPEQTEGQTLRLTVTARDGSGNIGRSSMDLAPQTPTYHFTDISGYWGASFVNFLYDSGVTTGYADGTFRPDRNITRAQFAVMLYRYLGLEEGRYTHVELPFADLKDIGDYALPAIRALYAEGILNGTTGKDGRSYLNPNASLTRAQAATMIGRTQSKGYAVAELTFADGEKIPAYARYYIQTMAAQGVIGGYTDGTFKPNNNITRGQMAKILYSLM